MSKKTVGDTFPRPRVMKFSATRIYVGSIARTTLYTMKNAGLFPPGFLLSPKTRAWYVSELDQWLAARARGASDVELRQLVKSILDARNTLRVNTPP